MMFRIIIASLVLLLSASGLEAQTPTLSKKEIRRIQKEEKKKIAAEQAKLAMEKTIALLSDTVFVLEADQVYDRYGQNFRVDRLINFVTVEDGVGIIQLGNNFSTGANFLGGITIKGPIDKYMITRNEKRNILTVNFIIRSPRGIYDVTVATMGSDRVDATVRGNFSGSVRYLGNLLHPDESKIFTGVSL